MSLRVNIIKGLDLETNEPGELLLTISDLERITGHSFRTLKRRLTISPVGKESRKQFYKLSDILKCFIGAEQENQNKLDLTQERAKLAIEQAANLRLNREITQGKYAEVEVVQKRWEELVLAARAKLLALPSRVAPLVQNLETIDAELCIKDAIYEALEELSNDV